MRALSCGVMASSSPSAVGRVHPPLPLLAVG
jgi:hypothetical protein